ncbi:CAP domain-containing protein [Scenedesmus sp. NREL 46B-D3]|nr:CAP domain-containing protein [Scenedesmus sp. NREL 46B-D3]
MEMQFTRIVAVLALLTVSLSPACGSAKAHGLNRRALQQDASLQDAGTSVQAGPPINPDPLEDTPFTAVTADFHAADIAAAAAARPSWEFRVPIVEVPNSSPGAAAAVVPAQTTTITMYEQCNFGGRSSVASIGNYPRLAAPWNDVVSSVRVPQGLKLTLREDRSYKGRGITITGPANIACLSSRRFNDITSSMRIVSTSGSGGGTGTTPGGGPVGGGVDSQLLTLVNAARRQDGLRVLSINVRLNTAAQAHSQDQARMQTMSHTSSDGTTFDVRITRAGYRWMGASENVAAGYTTAQSVFNGWLGSPGHRANILGNSVHMGVGLATGANGVMYWTQVFATPA